MVIVSYKCSRALMGNMPYFLVCKKNTYDDKCQSSILLLHCCAMVMLKFIWEFGKDDICIHILFVVIENCVQRMLLCYNCPKALAPSL
jgi:hypothetical protein